MKVLPFKIPKPEKEALVYQEDHEIVFYDKLHQHEEIQISYIMEGSGSLILGDSINEYQPHDILIIGENIPHVFRSDAEAHPNSIMYTLFFTKKSFGKEFFNLTDLSGIQKFFDESEYGMKIKADEKKFHLFNNLKRQSKIERVATLLLLLNELTHAERQPLSSFVYQKKYTEDEGKRMNDVFQYAMDNFQENISLDDIADIAFMSKNAFCRYFKKRTNKTFFQFLIEIRIEHACKLLYKDHDLSISAISELCGFQNIANFNRKFKELKGITPTQYRQQTD
ncbi:MULTISPECIES: helix-turn-helix domain-containing protein [Zunongwangia]|jgi:AraC-like DNA-binding protein|uniref:Activator protein MtlR n=3 Tax=Zunongwangia profunda TaxID=398743 RepID=D5BK42_ZUNPS|nr:AraC family transcriptional regulator [Zunongwangia profunda]MAS69995.1 AraC family transcriptional regulator [Zunongwangia sp.]ADF51722.1 activator protein MtlR [Zunongwangia profunda SM-A87]MCC4229593.1 AraC family transcriptional regulator [Zunongwangia profunda]HAJ82224.1 AraC family transcriptional regulator [Zunongwangia profunda]HCV79530.1 AraC family transcriptional regulator [Zunongwangia profunda]|tara:strand:+ start:101 stop:943 length:843 start_codon:yes stop_codon:yes gene_type:complete